MYLTAFVLDSIPTLYNIVSSIHQLTLISIYIYIRVGRMFVAEKTDTQYSVNKHGLKISPFLKSELKKSFWLAKRS